MWLAPATGAEPASGAPTEPATLGCEPGAERDSPAGLGATCSGAIASCAAPANASALQDARLHETKQAEEARLMGFDRSIRT